MVISVIDPPLHTLSHNQLNDNHDHVGDDDHGHYDHVDGDDRHNDHVKDDDPPAPLPSPERRLFCTQSDKHHCFQPNFTAATSIKPLCFRSPANSTVIVFVTQKKRWHLFISQFISALKSTAATNLIIIIMIMMPPFGAPSEKTHPNLLYLLYLLICRSFVTPH